MCVCRARRRVTGGMAFVDMHSEEQMLAALALHQSQLLGRRITVERSAQGGGKKSGESVRPSAIERASVAQSRHARAPSSEVHTTGDVYVHRVSYREGRACVRRVTRAAERRQSFIAKAKGERDAEKKEQVRGVTSSRGVPLLRF